MITEADDGGWLRIAFRLNEHGLPEYRDHLLKFNNESNGTMIEKEVIVSLWAGSRGFSIGHRDDTTWYRWPRRDPAADALPAGLQSVTLHRHSWVDHGRCIPVRFTGFHVEPICVRYFYRKYPVKVPGPMFVRERDG